MKVDIKKITEWNDNNVYAGKAAETDNELIEQKMYFPFAVLNFGLFFLFSIFVEYSYNPKQTKERLNNNHEFFFLPKIGMYYLKITYTEYHYFMLVVNILYITLFRTLGYLVEKMISTPNLNIFFSFFSGMLLFFCTISLIGVYKRMIKTKNK